MTTETTPPQGLRARNKHDKLVRIRAAADRLFEGQGYDGTTVEQIAREADVAKGTVFLYARDKQELLILVFLDRIGHLVDTALSTVPEAPVLEQILHLFEGLIEHYATVPALAKRFIREALFLDGDKGQAYQELTIGFVLQLADLLDAAQQRGELRPGFDRLQASRNIFAVYAMTLVDWLSEPTPQAEAGLQQLRAALAQLFDGLR